jgi:hypothetical protein
LALPVRVNVHAIAPVAVTVGLLHDALKPAGSPETRLMLVPPGPAGGEPESGGPFHGLPPPLRSPVNWLTLPPLPTVCTVKPPSGVAVTVTVAVACASIESGAGETDSEIPGACCTCKIKLRLETRPSPVAVTTMPAEPAVAEDEAASVSVLPFALTLEAGVSGLAAHCAVTLAGSPLTDKPMLPLKDPPVTIVKTAVF